jgi:hypothetical protein
MLKKLKRLTCRHTYMWSERRQSDICYHCGRVRAPSDTERASPTQADWKTPAPRQEADQP